MTTPEIQAVAQRMVVSVDAAVLVLMSAVFGVAASEVGVVERVNIAGVTVRVIVVIVSGLRGAAVAVVVSLGTGSIFWTVFVLVQQNWRRTYHTLRNFEDKRTLTASGKTSFAKQNFTLAALTPLPPLIACTCFSLLLKMLLWSRAVV